MCEISNGINSIQLLNIPLNYKIILSSFILSFSSLMILVQIFTFASRFKITFKDLLKYKLLQGGLSSFITYIVINYIYIPTSSVFNNGDMYLNICSHQLFLTHVVILILIALLSVITFGKKRQAKPVA